MAEKKTIAVIFGGQSAEHEISLMSASNIIEAMNKEKFDIVRIGITKQGKWMICHGGIPKIVEGNWQDEKGCFEEIKNLDNPVLKKVDVIFPVLHGPMGEDGTVQGLFELIGKPYVGCGVLASAICMDKVYAKVVFEKAGIPQVGYDFFGRKDWQDSREAIIKRLEEKFQYPMFIKPPNMGSSIGVSKANDRAELVKGVGESLKYDTKVLVEKYIDGRELECAVLGNDELIVSLPGEILPSEEFYDYKAKYFDGGKSRLMIPANIPEDTVKQIQKYALEAFRAADCSGLSRVDFFLEKSTGNIYLNEINTLPGFTNISMYPKLLGHLGISYAEVLERLIDLAVERFKAKNRN